MLIRKHKLVDSESDEVSLQITIGQSRNFS